MKTNLTTTRNVINSILNTVFTVVLLFTLLISLNASLATFNSRLPSVFGYSVSRIESGSMEATGYMTGDYVVMKKVQHISELRVGDIVGYYANSNRKPIRDNQDRSQWFVIFHEIVGVGKDASGNTYFVTKGSSNPNNDDFPVYFDSVAGKHVPTSPFLNGVFSVFLQENAFLFWIIACLVLIVLRQSTILINAIREANIQRRVLKGELNLLAKPCFDLNVFEGFKEKDKQKLIDNAPSGMPIIYEYLLTGKITDYSHTEVGNQIKNKSYMTVDALCVLNSITPDSHICTNSYINTLPGGKGSKSKGKSEKYTNVEDFKNKSKAERLNGWSTFIGCIIFTVLYFTLGYFSGYFTYCPWYAIYPIIIIPIFAALMLISTLQTCNQKEKKLNKQLSITPLLPSCYCYILRPYKYTAEEINEFVIEIEKIQATYLLKPQPQLELLEGTVSDPTDETYEIIAKEPTPQITSTTNITNVTNIYITESDLVEQPTEEEIIQDSQEDDSGCLPEANEDPSFIITGKSMSFTERITAADFETVERYNIIRNQLEVYKGIKGRISEKYDTYRKGRLPLARLSVRGNTLRVYFNLDPRVLDSRFYIRDVSEKKIFQEFPALLNVRSTRSLNYAVELINKLAEIYDLRRIVGFEEVDYVIQIKGSRPVLDDPSKDIRKKIAIDEIVTTEPVTVLPTVIEIDEEENQEVVTKDSFLNEVRQILTFQDRLTYTTDDCKNKYNLIKNELMSFNKINSRRTVRFDTFRGSGRIPLARITIRGDIIRLYLALDPQTLEAKYFIKDVSDKQLFAEYPSLLNVRSNRSLNYALELIRHLMYSNNINRNHKYEPMDYVTQVLVDEEGED